MSITQPVDPFSRPLVPDRGFNQRAPRIWVLVLACVAACEQAPEPVGGPEVKLSIGLPAPPQARLYADCIAQAAETGSYQRERDGGTLRFSCAGSVAKSFYDGLGAWSTELGSEIMGEGRTWRFSKKLIKDSYGVDGCSTDGAGDYQCVVILNVGPFIDRLDYPAPK